MADMLISVRVSTVGGRSRSLARNPCCFAVGPRRRPMRAGSESVLATGAPAKVVVFDRDDRFVGGKRQGPLAHGTATRMAQRLQAGGG